MSSKGSFRAEAVEAVRADLGDPEVLTTNDGPIFRWTLRGPGGRIVRILINSPEFPDVTHFNISDNHSADPLTCQVARSIREVRDLLSRYLGLADDGMRPRRRL